MSSFSEKASFNIKLLTAILALCTIGVSIYLTQHFYQVHFPTTLNSGGLCNLNSFFNCASATNSSFSNIFGAPISSLGILIGALFFMGVTMPAFRLDGSVILFGSVNVVGCIVLFLYSLISLGTLCPFCTLYYILSAALLFLYIKYSDEKKALPLHSSIIAACFILVTFIGHIVYEGKQKDILAIKDDLIKQFDELEPLAAPNILSPLQLESSFESFTDAPIQLMIFSDFQCPACKALSDMMHPVIRRYKGKINIKYYFYPLDPSCNKEMKNSLHPLACKAAYLSYCLPQEFGDVHDEIFNHQKSLSLEWLDNLAQDKNVTTCMNSEETKSAVVEIVDQGNEYGVKSTPTILLNNIKIEGVLPLNQLYILMDELVRRHEQKATKS